MMENLKDSPLLEGANRCADLEQSKGCTTAKIGTSMWVPACRGDPMGTREKKRKVGRMDG